MITCILLRIIGKILVIIVFDSFENDQKFIWKQYNTIVKKSSQYFKKNNAAKSMTLALVHQVALH